MSRQYSPVGRHQLISKLAFTVLLAVKCVPALTALSWLKLCPVGPVEAVLGWDPLQLALGVNAIVYAVRCSPIGNYVLVITWSGIVSITKEPKLCETSVHLVNQGVSVIGSTC